MRKKRARNAVHNCVVISDTHAGCRLSILPPGGADLDDGGVYKPSPLQQKLWAYWNEFWSWVDEVTEGEPYHVVHNGDAVEGVHHRSTTQISHNIEDQIRIGVDVLAPVAHLARESGGHYFHVRGTEAHVGASARDEENLARQLGARPNEHGQHARWDLWLDLDGSLIQFLHHVGTVSSSAYEATAVHKEMTESYTEAARWGQQPPDMICRAHRHRYLKVEVSTARGRGIAVVGPGWQAKTPFAYRIAGARVSLPQFGGYIICKKHGVLYTREWIRTIERSKTEV